MTHSNLTAADVAKYFGAKVTVGGGPMNIIGINFKDQELRLKSDSDINSFWYEVVRCHLLLKPLSQLSEDDAVEVAKIANIGKYEAKKHIGCGKDELRIIGHFIADDFRSKTYSELRIHTDKYIAIIDYLRKKGYDMDNYLTTNKAKHG